MSELTTAQIQALMTRVHNIRNVSVIDYGSESSALFDNLATTNNAVPTEKFDSLALSDLPADHATQGEEEEQEDSLIVERLAISLRAKIAQDDLADFRDSKVAPLEGSEFLINLVNSAGSMGYSPEAAAAAIRVTDGALFVVNANLGIGVQTELALRQTLNERVKPLLCIDIHSLDFTKKKEDIYTRFVSIIDDFNDIISNYPGIPSNQDWSVSPQTGSVAFVNTFEGWAFTIRTFAAKYAEKFDVKKSSLIRRLWGENYFDSKSKRWNKTGKDVDGEPIERSFNMFILAVISKIYTLSKEERYDELKEATKKLRVELTDEEWTRGRAEEQIFGTIMKKLLPMNAISEILILQVPPPSVAQKYRAEILYEGPTDDEVCIGIVDCNADAPLMVYISRLISTSEKGRFYALGRVFAGTLKPGMDCTVQTPGYRPGGRSKEFLFRHNIQRVSLLEGTRTRSIGSITAGSIVGLAGLDRFLIKSGTLTTSEQAHSIKEIRTSPPVLQIAVEVVESSELPILVEGLKNLAKSNPSVTTNVSEMGEHLLSGPTDEHLQKCFDVLKENIGIQIKVANPTVEYRETVTKTPMEHSSVGREIPHCALAKSPNKHNRIYMYAEPIGDSLSAAVDAGKVHPRDDFKKRARVLADEYDWDATDARKIWSFGPDMSGPNLLVDMTKWVQYLNEIKDSAISGFQWATKEGPICEEPMRSIRFNIADVTMMSSAIHRGGGQIIPTFRRAVNASTLMAQPDLMEPVYLADIQVVEHAQGKVYKVLAQHECQVSDTAAQKPGAQLVNIKAYLPVRKSFGFVQDIRYETGANAITSLVFDHWRRLDMGDVLDPTSRAYTEIIADIRRRKGVNPVIPPLDRYCDKL